MWLSEAVADKFPHCSHRWEPLVGGWASSVFALTVTSNTTGERRRYIAKTSLAGNPPPFSSFETSHYAFLSPASRNLTPQVVATFTDSTLTDAATLFTYLPGENFMHVLVNSPSEVWLPIVEHAVARIRDPALWEQAQLSQLPRYTPRDTFVTSVLASRPQYTHGVGERLWALAGEVTRNLLERVAGESDTAYTPVGFHNDFRPGNLLANNGNGKLVLSGIVDWGHARYGHPEWQVDVSRLVVNVGLWSSPENFVEATRVLPEDYGWEWGVLTLLERGNPERFEAYRRMYQTRRENRSRRGHPTPTALSNWNVLLQLMVERL